MIEIGFVIVNYCGVRDTIECICSLYEADRENCNIEVCIIDNASPKDIADIGNVYECLKQKYGVSVFNLDTDNNSILAPNLKIRIIKSKKNGGFGFGNNIGLLYFKRRTPIIDLCILLNNDTIVEPDFIKKIINTSELFSKAPIALSPLSINYYDHSIVDSRGFGYFDMCTGRSSHNNTYNTKYLVGSCIIMNCMNDVPLFDENFFLYCEDTDYSLELQNKGYDLKYLDIATFYHKVSASTSCSSKMDIIKLNSMKYLIKKRGTISNYIIFKILRTLFYLKKQKLYMIKALWN